ncbi:hypothetical protein Salat_1586600 [Sesamum alatum]|uniref:Uncharacterized protein n=1 Tax=Sesamum alatum TaxID=300844 RepID=A0AAE1YE25_9LAMI|nr:hypothetical protein Salat_1586600 [Sesamum alatum]
MARGVLKEGCEERTDPAVAAGTRVVWRPNTNGDSNDGQFGSEAFWSGMKCTLCEAEAETTSIYCWSAPSHAWYGPYHIYHGAWCIDGLTALLVGFRQYSDVSDEKVHLVFSYYVGHFGGIGTEEGWKGWYGSLSEW